MRRFFCLLSIHIICLLFVFPSKGQSMDLPVTSATNAILMEASSGRILYEQAAHEQRSIASITKVMTAIIAIEHGNLEEKVTISERAINAEGSSIYLQRGEIIPLIDLLYGLFLRSGNDAAIAIAEHIGGSVEGFTFLMNEKARLIGMDKTNFTNPHGLETDNHYSTAYDMALLMKYAMENEEFQRISATKVYKSKERTYAWHNKNKLLTTLYEYCTGGKTGFTKKAGRTLITTATKDNLDLIAVTLHASNDWQDHITLFNWGFSHFNLVLIQQSGKQHYVTPTQTVSGYTEHSFLYPLKQSEYKDVRREVRLYANALHANHEDNKEIGHVQLLLQNESIYELPIYTLPLRESRKSSQFLNTIKKIFRIDHYG